MAVTFWPPGRGEPHSVACPHFTGALQGDAAARYEQMRLRRIRQFLGVDFECARTRTVAHMNDVTDRLRSLVLEHAVDGTDLPSLSDELVRSMDLPTGLGDDLPIAEVSALTGITVHTLRYYERIGLVSVARDGGGRRVYDREALGRVVFITRLRMSDMPIRDIQRYVELVEQGQTTVPERLDLLIEHRASVQSRMANLQWALAVIDYKITTYGGDCAP